MVKENRVSDEDILGRINHYLAYELERWRDNVHKTPVRICNVLFGNVKPNRRMNDHLYLNFTKMMNVCLHLKYLDLDSSGVHEWQFNTITGIAIDNLKYPLFLLYKCINLQVLKLKLQLPIPKNDNRNISGHGKPKHKIYEKEMDKWTHKISLANQLIDEQKHKKLEQLRVIHVVWTQLLVHTDIAGDGQHAAANDKYQNKKQELAFELVHGTMNCLVNLGFKENITQFGYCYHTQTSEQFDKMLHLAKQFDNLKVFEFGAPMSMNTSIDKKSLMQLKSIVDNVNEVAVDINFDCGYSNKCLTNIEYLFTCDSVKSLSYVTFEKINYFLCLL